MLVPGQKQHYFTVCRMHEVSMWLVTCKHGHEIVVVFCSVFPQWGLTERSIHSILHVLESGVCAVSPGESVCANCQVVEALWGRLTQQVAIKESDVSG